MSSFASIERYKFQFVSEPGDSLRCPLCLQVAEDPWQHSKCGRLFCKTCLVKYGEDKPCSHCKMEQPQYFEDTRSRQDIKDLKVRCCNVETHCKWEGTVSTLKSHLSECDFTLYPCPNGCIDNEMNTRYFMKQDLDRHQSKECPKRPHECVYGDDYYKGIRNYVSYGNYMDKCREKGTYFYITMIHDQVCEYKLATCPNTDCKCQIQLRHIDAHVKSCEDSMIRCRYESIGCCNKMKRKVMWEHERDEKAHFHLALYAITQLKKDDAITRFKKDEANRSPGEAMTFKYPFYQHRKDKKSSNSKAYYTSQKYLMALTVHADGDGSSEGTHVSVYIATCPGEYDQYLKWPLLGRVTFELLNQLEDKYHHTASVSLKLENSKTENKCGFAEFIPHSGLDFDPVKKTQYLKDDTLYFRVTLNIDDWKPWLQYVETIY